MDLTQRKKRDKHLQVAFHKVRCERVGHTGRRYGMPMKHIIDIAFLLIKYYVPAMFVANKMAKP